jgi:hypothetical protein
MADIEKAGDRDTAKYLDEKLSGKGRAISRLT